MFFWQEIEKTIDEILEHELENAFRAGYREAAAMYGRNMSDTQLAYKESEWRAAAYIAERKENN